MADPLTPPVPLPEPPTVTDLPAQVDQTLTVVQRFVAADKSAVMAALVHVAILLVAALNLHLTAEQIAVLGSIVSVGLNYFLGMHFKKS